MNDAQRREGHLKERGDGFYLQVGKHRAEVNRVSSTDLTHEYAWGGHPRFRDILSEGTRPLKHAPLGFVTDEPMRAALTQEPRGHTRNHRSQMRAS
jgi:hypothetical protein